MDYIKIAIEYEDTVKKYERLIDKEQHNLSTAKAEYQKMNINRQIKFYRRLIIELKTNIAILRERAGRM